MLPRGRAGEDERKFIFPVGASMAEENQNENQDDDKPKGGGIKSLLVTLVVGILAIAAGLATPYLLTSQSSDSEEQEQPEVEIPEETGKAAFVEFGEVVVNLDGPRLTRYLRLKIILQVDEAEEENIKTLVEEQQLILKDWLIRYLAGQQMDSIRGEIGQNRLRREIKDYFNTALFPDGYERIKALLFEEFNVQ